MFVLNVTKRKGKEEGEIPAVFYGAEEETTSISVPVVEFKKMWDEAGESSAIQISYEGKEINVLIHEVQVHPVSGEPLHVDFLAIDMNKKIEVSVPLEFVGISGAVKNGLGNLVKVLHEVDVEALPGDLPQHLEVDLSKLETIEDQIYISDIVVPQGVEVTTSQEEVVASIILQVEEKEEEPEEIDLSSIEVEKKGKDEEEGEETQEPKEEEKKEEN